ncbi:tetratricopeptide repeat protein [Pontiellaceae bacterium B1224]|nr:tetratricopeptide repeat protein [Pontiellaceae bacterium B1224]
MKLIVPNILILFLAYVVSGVENANDLHCSGFCSNCTDSVNVACIQEFFSIEEGSDTGRIRALAQMYYSGFEVRDKKKAAELYLKLAEAGDSDAMFKVGRLYRRGEGFDEDREAATKWFSKGALEKGNILCCLQLVQMHQSGSDNDETYARWSSLAEKLADDGDAEAKYFVGTSYKYGAGFPLSINKAVVWLEQAADQGSTGAMCDLIDIYYLEEGHVDFEKARYWLGELKKSEDDWRDTLGKMLKVKPDEVEVHFAKIEYGLFGSNKERAIYPVKRRPVLDEE